jgi:hypothetical protein
MPLVQFSLASSLHLSFVLELSRQAIGMDSFSDEYFAIFTVFMDTATVMYEQQSMIINGVFLNVSAGFQQRAPDC